MTESATGDNTGPRVRPHRAIAVDGSAASGKSTIGRKLASVLGFDFLDTGVMYRAVTWAALKSGIDPHKEDSLAALASSLQIDVSLVSGEARNVKVEIDGEDVTDSLRLPEVEENVSLVSRVPGVRDALVKRQRVIASRAPIVMAGRDIGTVVLPNADLKIYLDASLAERSRRRHEEFVRSGREGSRSDVMGDIRRRDQIDKQREVSPLRPAGDAVVIQTDGRDVDDILEHVLELARNRI